MRKHFYSRLILVIPFLLINFSASSQAIDGFQHGKDHTDSALDHVISNEFQFNGYTNHWHDTYSNWYRYGNLYKMAIPNVEKTILQSKVDIAEDMGVSGLVMQEGFMSGLISGQYISVDQPSLEEGESAGFDPYDTVKMQKE